MGLKAQFKPQDFSAYYEKLASKMIEEVIELYRFEGERFIADARSNAPMWKQFEVAHGTPKAPLEKRVYRDGKIYRLEPAGGTGFMDWTANLRSSIGYMIFLDGQIVADTFPVEGGGQEGAEKGRGLAVKVASEYPDGILFVGTAGMEYAIHVEAKGYDVITTSANVIEGRIKPKINKLLNDLQKWQPK